MKITLRYNMADTDALYAQFIADSQSADGYGNSGKYARLVNSLHDLLKAGFKFNENQYCQFNDALTKICYTRTNAYSTESFSTITTNKLKFISEIVINNFETSGVTEKTMSYIFANPDSGAINHIIKQKKISNELVRAVIETNKIHGYYTNKFLKCTYLLKLIKDNNIEINLEQEDLSKLVANFSVCSDLIMSYYSNSKNIPDSSTISAAIKHTTLETVKDLLIFGGELTTDHLKVACEGGNVKTINFILDSNVKSTDDCIKLYISSFSGGYTSYRRRSSVSKTKSKKSSHSFVEEWEKVIDKLILCGATLKYDHVVLLLKKGKELSNIDKYDITLKDNFSAECAKVSFYPYSDKLKVTVKTLEEECAKGGNLSRIKELVTTHKLKPTVKCLEGACKHKSNVQTIRFLMENHNVIPNSTCLKNIINCVYNRSLTIVSDSFIENHDKMVKQLAKLEGKEDEEDNISDVNSDSEDEKSDYDISDDESDFSYKRSPKPKKNKKKVMSESEESEESDDCVEPVNNIDSDLSESESEESIVSVKKSITKKKSKSKTPPKPKKSVKVVKSEKSQKVEEPIKSVVKKVKSKSKVKSLSDSSDLISDSSDEEIKPVRTKKTTSKSKKSESTENESKSKTKKTKKIKSTSTKSNDIEILDDEIMNQISAEFIQGDNASKDSNTKKSKTKKLEKKSSSRSVGTDDSITDTESVDVKTFKDIPEKFNFKDEHVLDAKLKKELKIKSTKCDFLEFRRALFEYISKEKLVVNKNIKINKNLSEHLNVDDTETPFSNLDKLAYNLLF